MQFHTNTSTSLRVVSWGCVVSGMEATIGGRVCITHGAKLCAQMRFCRGQRPPAGWLWPKFSRPSPDRRIQSACGGTDISHLNPAESIIAESNEAVSDTTGPTDLSCNKCDR